MSPTDSFKAAPAERDSSLTSSNPAAKNKQINNRAASGGQRSGHSCTSGISSSSCPWVAQEEGHSLFPVCHLSLGFHNSPALPKTFPLPTPAASPSCHISRAGFPTGGKKTSLAHPSLPNPCLQRYHGNRTRWHTGEFIPGSRGIQGCSKPSASPGASSLAATPGESHCASQAALRALCDCRILQGSADNPWGEGLCATNPVQEGPDSLWRRH